MNTGIDHIEGPHGPILPARAISLAVSAIRRAQGKLLPRDCAPNTPQWFSVMEDFALDVTRALDAMDAEQ
ncbi:hypothetical protein AAGS40_29765 (plasmid) [Paraburkholderia sp. PREW-6R]|uniref:hypothetical protein n=1 Tax=Paraburkholderia sp. PREW-6R TaxID=3141544 RepID=UPI0031F53906